VNFQQDTVTINNKEGITLVTGRRDPYRNLYMINIPSGTPRTPIPNIMVSAGNAYTIRPMKKVMQYLHATAGFPPLKTFIAAIERNAYLTWPGLNKSNVTTLLEPSPYTAMGHLHMISQGIRSTQPRVPHRHTTNHRISVNVVPTTQLKYTVASDLPGRYPITSARGHKYIFLMVDYDSNYIHAVPIKSRKADALVDGFRTCYKTLLDNGLQGTYVRLDNEASRLLTTYIREQRMEYQLASPGDHRINYAERAIQTYKNHFISTLQGTTIPPRGVV